MKKYQDFKKIQEVRKPKKCPVLSFRPLRDSEIFQDMLAMGFVEALPEKPAGVETEGPSEQRNFKDRLGNIAFYHPDFNYMTRSTGYPHFNIMHNGSVRIVIGKTKSSEFPGLSQDLRRACMTVEDYLFKMGFLIKYLLREKGLQINDQELYGEESYKDLILRKIKEDPSAAKNIEIPPSLKKSDDTAMGASVIKRFGGFGA
jgi:hypothetical protein